MVYEQFANSGASSLAAAIDDSVTSLTVASSVGFPTIGDFRIIVDSEIMRVTDVQGNVFTVVRGEENTSAAAHDEAAAVFHVLTAGALVQRDLDQIAAGTPTERPAAGQAGRLYLPSKGYVNYDMGSQWESMLLWKMTPPNVGDFTWVNQGTSTATDQKGMLVIEPQIISSGDSFRLLVKTAPSTPFSITICMLAQNPDVYGAYAEQYGLCWRESSSGKIINVGFCKIAANAYYQIYKTRWNSPTSYSANVSSQPTQYTCPKWLRIADDGTYRYEQISGDGVTFHNIFTPVARTEFITADQVGISVRSSVTSDPFPRIVSVLSWSEE